MKRTLIVTATPPTTNGDLHIGHLSGPYLAADVFARYQRMAGRRVAYLCSGDDHQSYVQTTAERQRRDPRELANHYTEVIQQTLQAADIVVDLFTSSLANERHIAAVQSLFVDLYRKGVLKERIGRLLYCETCTRYLFESFAKGRCPFCREDAAGNLCEACGRVNDPTELLAARCSLCGNPPDVREYRGLFLPLEEHRVRLMEFYESRTTWRPHLRALCDWLVSRPMRDYPVTYPSNWGVPVPIQGFEDQVINVWFEMYPGHLNTLESWREQQAQAGTTAAPGGDGYELIQFLGYDNSFFNAVVHLVTALSADGDYPVPEHVITNEFYLLNGEKFSTSRNHAIWGSEVLQDTSSDCLRFYLAQTNPEHMQTNFTRREFFDTVADDFVGLWSGILDEFFRCVRSDFVGPIEMTVDPDLDCRGLLLWAKQQLERSYGVKYFSLRRASTVLHEYVTGCYQYLHRSLLPTREADAPTYEQRLGSLAYMLRGLAYFASPLLPRVSQRLYSALGYDGLIESRPWAECELLMPVVGKLQAPKEWFPRNNASVRVALASSVHRSDRPTEVHGR